MKWWSNSEEMQIAQWVCDALNVKASPTEGSLGAKFVVPQDRLEDVLSFLARNNIKFWTSFENRCIIIYVLKQ